MKDSIVNQHQLAVAAIKKKVRPVLRRYGVKQAAVFGSLVRGELKPTSDIDLLIQLDQPMSLFTFAGLQSEFAQTLGRRVDLGEYDTLKPQIKERVLAEQVPIL